MKRLKNYIMRKYGYTVIGYTKQGKAFGSGHYTVTFREALEWVACYKGGATVYLNGHAVAHRNKLGA